MYVCAKGGGAAGEGLYSKTMCDFKFVPILKNKSYITHHRSNSILSDTRQISRNDLDLWYTCIFKYLLFSYFYTIDFTMVSD